MLGGGVAVLLGGQLLLLQGGVGRHALLCVPLGQLEDAVVEGVEAGQGHELEGIPQLAQVRLQNALTSGRWVLEVVDGEECVLPTNCKGERRFLCCPQMMLLDFKIKCRFHKGFWLPQHATSLLHGSMGSSTICTLPRLLQFLIAIDTKLLIVR